MGTLKDRLTNYVGLVTVLLTGVLTYLQSTPEKFDWQTLGTGLVIALLSYVTGKGSDLKPKV